MNILIMSIRGPSNNPSHCGGGAGEFIVQIGKRWLEQGHNVTILCCRHGNGLPESESVFGINVVRSGLRATALMTLPGRYRAYAEWADVVVENLLEVPLLTPLYVDKPLVVIGHHLVGCSYFRTTNPAYALVGVLGEHLGLGLAYRNTRFAVPSEETARDLVKLGVLPQLISLMPEGVDDNLYRLGSRKIPTPSIFFVGRLDDGRKRVQDLIKAFQLVVLPRCPGATLVIAGGGKKVEALRRQTAGLPIEVLGQVSEAKKVSLYQESWVFATPSIKEGFGLTGAESSACGTPVVAYDTPGLVTVHQDVNGLRVPMGDWKALGEALSKVLIDRELRSRLTNGAIKLSEQWSWQSSSVALMNILQSARHGYIASPCMA